MVILDYRNQNISQDTFFKVINDTRKGNKDRWYTFVGVVNNKEVAVKGFNTWLQVYRVDGLNQPTLMDIPVKQFNQDLARPFTTEAV